MKIMLCAVEPSGDAHGAALMASLKRLAPEVQFTGCGGALMAAEGLESLFPIHPFAVIGPAGALKALPAALAGASRLAQAAAAADVDAAVLIDGWSFARIAARKIRRRSPGTKLFKYVAPQVWASRPHRAKTLAGLFDGVLTLFEFEVPYFEKEGVRTKCVGNGLFQEALRSRGDAAAFRARHGLDAAPLLAIAPGSRSGEIARLMGPFRRTVELAAEGRPELRIAVSVAPSVAPAVRAALQDWPADTIAVPADERFDLFAAADVALAASGTVTTELAIHETPTVVAYRVHWAAAAWARRVYLLDHVSMVNIASGRAVMPEFLQEECRPELMAEALTALLDDPAAREAQRGAFPAALEKLGAGGAHASDLAARTILEWIGG